MRIIDNLIDKISNKILRNKLIGFYTLNEELSKDYRFISLFEVMNKITLLKNKGFNIICNLFDRDGIIDMPIIDSSNDEITLKNGKKITLSDRFLYALILNMKKNEFSLEIDGEYYEKIVIYNEEN